MLTTRRPLWVFEGNQLSAVIGLSTTTTALLWLKKLSSLKEVFWRHPPIATWLSSIKRMDYVLLPAVYKWNYTWAVHMKHKIKDVDVLLDHHHDAPTASLRFNTDHVWSRRDNICEETHAGYVTPKARGRCAQTIWGDFMLRFLLIWCGERVIRHYIINLFLRWCRFKCIWPRLLPRRAPCVSDIARFFASDAAI